MIEFIMNNYVLVLSIILISIITLIGYFIDRNRNLKQKHL